MLLQEQGNDDNSKVQGSWYEGNNNKSLDILRRCLDLYNKDEINKVLMEYTRTVEFIMVEFPQMKIESRKDWAIANARSPDWFGDALATRVQNGMLVAALLLTVTASSFLSPAGGNQSDASLRVTFYLNGICSALFLISIFLGICFIENGMSRAYCWSDRFWLIIDQYAVKDISQICAIVGTLLFPLALLLPMQSTYLQVDSYVMYTFAALCGLLLVRILIRSNKAAAGKQNIRTMMLKDITDPLTGRLLQQFQPPAENLADAGNNENPQQTFELMYRKGNEVMKDSACGWLKLFY